MDNEFLAENQASFIAGSLSRVWATLIKREGPQGGDRHGVSAETQQTRYVPGGKRMTTICSVCGCRVGEVLPGNGISHGLCRAHELATAVLAGLMSAQELREWKKWPVGRRTEYLQEVWDATEKVKKK